MKTFVKILARGLLICGVAAACGCASSKDETNRATSHALSGETAAADQSAKAPAAVLSPPEPEKREKPDWIAAAKAMQAAPFEGGGWESLFGGDGLQGWKMTPFAGAGEVEVLDGLLILNMGDPFTGLTYTNEFPDSNYEIAFDAMRVMGSDFFCGLTVPVRDGFCSLILGGWGGSLVGISSIDGMDASENETTKFVQFENRRWYRVRLRVSAKRIEAWVGTDKVVDLDTEGRKLTVRPGEIEKSKPVGLACWQTTAVFREIKLRRVDGPADGPRRPRRTL